MRQKVFRGKWEVGTRERVFKAGLGKPEALKHELSGLWSRRITKEHRLVYSVSDQEIVIVSCKFHGSSGFCVEMRSIMIVSSEK